VNTLALLYHLLPPYLSLDFSGASKGPFTDPLRFEILVEKLDGGVSTITYSVRRGKTVCPVFQPFNILGVRRSNQDAAQEVVFQPPSTGTT